MVVKSNIIIRIFFSMLIIMFLFIFLGGIWFVTTGWSDIDAKAKLITPFGLLIILWLIIYCYSFITGLKIEIKDEEIIVKNWSNKFLNIDVNVNKFLNQFRLPNSVTIRIKINDVDKIFVGTLIGIENFCVEIGDTYFVNEIDKFKSNLLRNSNNFVIASFQQRTYLYFKMKNSVSQIADINLITKRKAEILIKGICNFNNAISVKWG